MYKIIAPILFTALFLTGCQQKGPNPKYLTDKTVVRNTEENKSVEKAARQEERFAKTGENGAEIYRSGESNRGNYHVIVSSYKPTRANQAKAEKLAKDLRELDYPDAEVLPEMLGRIRVSIGRFTTEQDAVVLRDYVRKVADRPDIWIFKAAD
ncbi:MAG: SPOR domain-containing protein [Culturomica sp.]|jgi:predicted small lipoprotein YifL|nr:SPOR domain-containing protein [Culturomica sp.]